MSDNQNATTESVVTDYALEQEERFLERLIFRNRGIVILLFLAVTAYLGYQMTNLSPDASFEKMIPADHPFIVSMKEHRADLGASGSSIQIAVEAVNGDILTVDFLETLRQVNDEIFYFPGVNRNSLKSIWAPSVRWMQVTPKGFEGGQVISGYNGTEATLETLKNNILRSGQVGRLVSNDFSAAMVQVSLVDRDPTTGEPMNYLEFSRKLEKEIRQKYENENVRIHIIGFGKVVGEMLEGIGAILVFALITIAITFLLLLLYCRCPRGAVAPLLCSMIAVIWQLGLLTVFGYGLNAYSILVPFLVLAIGVSHGVQMVNAMANQLSHGYSKLKAARLAFRSLYIVGVTALITDAFGFITLMVIEIEVIRDLGTAAGIGVAVIVLTNLVLLPVLLSYTGMKPARHRDDDYEYGGSKIWRVLSYSAHPKVATVSVVVAAALFTLGYMGSGNLKIGDLDPGAPELHPDSTYNLDVLYITDKFTVSTDTLITLVETGDGECLLYDNVELIDRFTWMLENVPGVQSVSSLSAIAKRVIMAQNEGSLKWMDISNNQQILNNTRRALPPVLANRDCSLAPVVAFLDDHKAETLERVVAAIEEFAGQYDSHEIHFRLAAGNGGIEAATNQVIEDAQAKILVYVYAVVILVVGLTFRSVTAILCIVIPLGLTSALCQALMAHLGIGIKVATLPVVALGVGVGVDYGFYIFSNLIMHVREGVSTQEAYRRALEATGKAVAFTGITLAIGVCTWVLSPIKFQADMGLLLAFMFLVNMLCALWLLPALSHFLIRSKAKTDKVTQTVAQAA
jgi:predicted RND superfamily exporter protein